MKITALEVTDYKRVRKVAITPTADKHIILIGDVRFGAVRLLHTHQILRPRFRLLQRSGPGDRVFTTDTLRIFGPARFVVVYGEHRYIFAL